MSTDERAAGGLEALLELIPCTCWEGLCSQPECGEIHEHIDPKCPRHNKAAPHIAAAKEREEKLWALVDKLKSSKAHTYASEHADHYRGFDVGQLRAAESLEALLKTVGIKRP